jgi:hypothetical protein
MPPPHGQIFLAVGKLIFFKNGLTRGHISMRGFMPLGGQKARAAANMWGIALIIG